MTKYAKLTAGLVGAWFVLSLTASALHLYQNSPNDPPLAFGLAALTPIAAFVIWFAVSPGLRQFTLSLNPRILTMVQSWRVIGFVFLILATYGILPRAFALPAGWGDIAIGATASFVGLKLASPNHRTGFIVWQVLGIVDLVMAVTLGTLAQVIDPNAISTAAMTVLPLSLIPTFVVPLLLILHIICIVQATRWPSPQRTGIGEPL
ncbi:MAG: hypothetical protein WBV55_16340, partial [Candidatus Sulfotelmatobacter sp.]